MLCIVHFGGRAPVGGPLRGNRRVFGWLPEAVVCFGGPPGSMDLTHTRLVWLRPPGFHPQRPYRAVPNHKNTNKVSRSGGKIPFRSQSCFDLPLAPFGGTAAIYGLPQDDLEHRLAWLHAQKEDRVESSAAVAAL